MTSLNPRVPYSQQELETLYPARLQLRLVQVFFRHGERTPAHARFENTGLPALWPYCTHAKQMMNLVMTNDIPTKWSSFEWQRRLETLESAKAPSPSRKGNSLCDMAELTDKGRRSTLDLGRRLRNLYVYQLGFLPKTIKDSESIYLRSSPYPRALASLHQAFMGLYPADKRDERFSKPAIVTRRLTDETLIPNEDFCQRFIQLSKAFSKRTADRWNSTCEMDYLNSLIQKWMPSQQRVAVDSQPKLHGIFDTINSTLASDGAETRLPSEFYSEKAREIIDRIVVEEEYAGYKESVEYRTLGIGALLSEVVQRMISHGLRNDHRISPSQRHNEDKESLKFALFASHDSTLAAILASLGAFESENGGWPSYTSSLAVELFQDRRLDQEEELLPPDVAGVQSRQEQDSIKTDGLYVRVRYNDRPIVVPGCRPHGQSLDGAESFCTLAAFKEIVDRFTPADWKQACLSNLGKSAFPTQKEPAGF